PETRHRLLVRLRPSPGHRRVDGPPIGLVQAGVLDLADDADDGRPRTTGASAFLESLADGSGVRKEPLRPRAIDHDDFDIRLVPVTRVEETTPHEGEAKQAKVLRRHGDPGRDR